MVNTVTVSLDIIKAGKAPEPKLVIYALIGEALYAHNMVYAQIATGAVFFFKKM